MDKTDEIVEAEKRESTELAHAPSFPRLSRPPKLVICPKGFDRSQLHDYLLRERSGAELDDTAQAIRRHLTTDCEACQRQINEIEAAEPFLRGEQSERPVVKVKTITKLPNEDLKREALIAELSCKLAAELATPAKSFLLEELSTMNTKIRTVSDIEKRRTMAQRVVEACNARWERVKNCSGLDPEIEAATSKLFTHMRTYDGQPEKCKVYITALGITSPKQTCDFLLYMMTSNWFLHPEGENTWDLEPASNSVVSASSEKIGSAHPETQKRLVFYIDVLKKALHAHSRPECPAQPGPTRA